MNNPKISIIIPVYNAEKYLRQCIDSVLSQTFTDFELILIDDCSPDHCSQICEDYAKQDLRIKVIHHKINQGSVISRKAGLDNSTGDYILFVDSDDWIEKNMTERLYQKAISDYSDIVYCDLIRFEGEKLTHTLPFDSRGKEKIDIIINIIEDNFPGYLPSKLFKRNLFNNVVWPDFQLREDVVICVQAFLNAEKVSYEYSTLYHYRFNSESISSDNKNRYRLINEVYENFRKLDNVLKNRPDYNIYRPSIEKTLKKYKINDRFRLYYYIKRFFMAFIPNGMIVMYRSYTHHNIEKFLLSFVPYGIIILYAKVKAKRNVGDKR